LRGSGIQSNAELGTLSWTRESFAGYAAYSFDACVNLVEPKPEITILPEYSIDEYSRMDSTWNCSLAAVEVEIAVHAAANYYSTEEKLTQSSFDLSSATPITESEMSQNSNPLRDQKEGLWRRYAHKSDLPPWFEIIEQENFLVMCTGHAKTTIARSCSGGLVKYFYSRRCILSGSRRLQAKMKLSRAATRSH
jgi:hypothetical protein